MYNRSNTQFRSNNNDRRNDRREQNHGQNHVLEFAPPVVFTHRDKTERRFTANEIYAEAGQVLRERHRFFANRRVIWPNPTHKNSDGVLYTLEQMSRYVQEAIQNAEDDMYYYLESRRIA